MRRNLGVVLEIQGYLDNKYKKYPPVSGKAFDLQALQQYLRRLVPGVSKTKNYKELVMSRREKHAKTSNQLTEGDNFAVLRTLQERKPVEAKLGVGDSDVTMEGDSGITSNSQDTMEKAMKDCESVVNAHLVNAANEASILRSFYSSTRFKQDRYDYREVLRYDLDKATTTILKMHNRSPDRQPSDEDLETSMAVVEGMPNVKKYDWAPYKRLVDEVTELSGIERETLLKCKSVTKRWKHCARPLYKLGFLNLNTLPDDKRNAFLQSPLVIGLGDGDFRGWKDLERGEKKVPVVIDLVKIPEFRTSIFCCSCHFRMRIRGRSVICDEYKWEGDRDHNAATNMSNAVLQFLQEGQ
ncbi:hypothetical protein EDD11_001062 [Mortierella claussenii]|nr:hypothetical protein EDD11_001062 [Mortierella claussenii]